MNSPDNTNADANKEIKNNKKPLSPWRWLNRLIISLILFLAVLGIMGYGLLYTAFGRDLVLGQIAHFMPEDMRLTLGRSEGTLAGTLTVYDARFEHEKITIEAEKLSLSLDFLALFNKTLHFKQVDIHNANLDINPSEEKTPFQWPRWPEMVPAIDLPIIIRADDFSINKLRIGRKILGQSVPLIHIKTAQGGIELNYGGIDARHIRIQSNLGKFNINGYYQPRKQYQTDLTLNALVPAEFVGSLSDNGPFIPLGLVARGDQTHMELALTVDLSQRLRLHLLLNDENNQPQWQLDLNAPELNISQWLPAADSPLTLTAQMNGQGEMLQLSGSLQQLDHYWQINESTWTLAEHGIEVNHLLLDIFGGFVQLQGDIDLSDFDNLTANIAIYAEQLTWENLHLSQGQLAISGGIHAWQTSGQLHVHRERQRAQLEFALSGNPQQMQVEQLMALTPEGSLVLTGSLAWDPLLSWQADGALANFDPGYFLPGWDGRLFGILHSHGQKPVDTPLQANVQVSQLHGHLRHKAVSAQAQVTMQGQHGQAQANLQYGESHLHATGSLKNDQLNLELDLSALHLADFLPGEGQLSGQIRLHGPIKKPDIALDLATHNLQWGDFKAEQLTLSGQLPWQGEHGQMQFQARTLEVGIVLDWLNIQANGSVQNLQLHADTRTDFGSLAVSGQLAQLRRGWQGELSNLYLAPARGATWRLQQSAAFRLQGNSFELNESCLASAAGGVLCTHINWPREGLFLRGEALPLALLHPWLPPNAGRPIRLRGELAIEGHMRQRGKTWDGYVQVQSPEGGISVGESGKAEELLRYEPFYTRIDMQPDGLDAQLRIGLQNAGYIHAAVELERSPGIAMRGELHTELSDLYWLEMFSPDLVRPYGSIEGHIELSGTRKQPLLGGQAQLRNFSAELPALGLSLSQGQAALDAQPDGSARISAQVHTGGKGALVVDGNLSWFGQAQPLQLHIGGQQVLLSNTAELKVVANPDLNLRLTGTTMELRGGVHIPEATIDLQRLDRGTSVSQDVVVLDPADPQASEAAPLDMDLQISLGQKVAMSGFGLKGQLGGQMQLRAQPGRESLINGELEITGRYKAYGQDLTITQGQLQWNHDIVSDPRLNIRAQRVVGEITVGIHVTGRAHQPWVEIWSDPAMSQSESLAYLILGRSLSLASDDEAQQLNAASTALSAGSGLLAAQLGAKLGLDDAGVSQSRALGASVIGVGKYLTPRLYLGYGVSLLGSGSVLTLKYLLKRGFDVEIETSTVENRTSLNWRREK